MSHTSQKQAKVQINHQQILHKGHKGNKYQKNPCSLMPKILTKTNKPLLPIQPTIQQAKDFLLFLFPVAL